MATTTWPAEVYVFDGTHWVSISPHGMSTLPPATGTTIGGVIVGAGINVAPDGTISVTHFSGDYNDLTNKPIIPTPVQSDWLATGGDAFIVNKPNYLSQFTNDLKVSAFANDANYVTAAGASAAAPVQSLIAGANVSISDDGSGNFTISSVGGGPGGGIVSVSGTAPIAVANGTTAPVISLNIGAGLKIDGGSLAADFSSLATVATTGNYGDLSGKPTIPTKVSDLTNDASYVNATQAAAAAPIQKLIAGNNVHISDDGSGGFTVSADGGGSGSSNVSVAAGYGTNVSSSSAGNLTIYTVEVNKTTLDGRYAAIASVPTKTSQLTNDSGYINLSQVPSSPVQSVAGRTGNVTLTSGDISGLATVATSGSYADLTNKPAIPTKTSDLTNDSGYITLTDIPADKVQSVAGRTGNVTLTTADIGGLAAVATSGSYADLTNKPTIPSKTSDLTNDAGYVNATQAAAAAPIQSLVSGANISITNDGAGRYTISSSGGGGGGGGISTVSGTAPISVADGTTAPVVSISIGSGLKVDSNKLAFDSSVLAAVATSGSYTDLSNKPSIPTKTSELTNDSGYITLAQVPSAPVQSVAGRTGAVTLTSADISGLSNVATSGDYADLSNKPTIPPAYTLPTANATTLGGVKIGSGLTMTGDVLSADAQSVPDASVTTKGIIQIADAANITAGTAGHAVDAAGLKTVTDQQTKDFVNVSGDTMTGPLQIIAGGPQSAAIKFADGAGIYQPGAKQLAITTGEDAGPDLTVSKDSVVAHAGFEATTTIGVGVPPPASTASAITIGGPAPTLSGGNYFAIQNTRGLKGTVASVAGLQNQVGFVNATVGTYRGIVQSNPDAAFFGTTVVTLYEGFSVSALAASLDSKIHEARSIHVSMNDSATATRWNIYATGSAPNKFDGKIVLGSATKPAVGLDVYHERSLSLRISYPPTSETASGEQGEIAWDSQFMYLCVNANTWRRIPLQNFDGSPSTRVAPSNLRQPGTTHGPALLVRN